MARRVDAFVRSLERSLDERGTTKTKRKLATVITSCGWKKRSGPRLQELSEALAHAGIYPDQDLQDLYLGIDTYVWFSRRPPLPVGQIFQQERAAGYHFGRYKDVLDSALPQYAPLVHKSGGNRKEKVYDLNGQSLIPDLVFRSGRSGPWIVCEIERGDPRRQSVPQLIDYMRAVARSSVC